MDEEDVIAVFNSIKNIFSFDFSLKKEQIRVIESVLNEQNTFALLPTGYGKSMCFILPPLLLDELDWTLKHIAIVISPLKSLMMDQVKELKNFNITSIAFEPGSPMETIQDIKMGKYSIVFISPESANSPFWRSLLLCDDLRSKICLLACDEAHCISEWGEDFRPAYKEVLNLRSIIDAPVLAVTGTCNEKVKNDVFKSLAFTDDVRIIAVAPDRPNIYLCLQRSKQDHESDLKWLLEYLMLEKHDAKKIIVYCRSVSATALLYLHFKDNLREHGLPDGIVEMFHRSIDEDDKVRILETFKKPDSCIRCLFATVAFGMGIQINDVRVIIHWGVSKSCLSYWQEVGRAGRNGDKALAICYAYGRSLNKQTTDENMIKTIQEAFEQKKCIRQSLLSCMSIGNDLFVLKKDKCDGCTGTCKCSLCMCCNICRDSCPCEDKTWGNFMGIDKL